MRRGFCFYVREKQSKDQVKAKNKNKNKKTKTKTKTTQTRLPPGLCFAGQKTSPKALRRAKCAFPHTSSPLHGRKSGAPKAVNADICTDYPSERIRNPEDRNIRTGIRAFDGAVREMLHLQADVQPVVEHIADTEMIAKLERR